MAVYPINYLQQVQTYQRSELGLLYNLACFVSTFNTRFKDFNNISTNLGSTVTFDKPPRATTSDGLVVSWQQAVQQVQSLVCSQSANSSFAVTSQERIFNLEKGEDEYISTFGKSFMTALANKIEIDVAKNAVSGVVNQGTGALITDSGPFRFFGDGSVPLTSYQQLAQEQVLFQNFGAATYDFKHYLPDVIIPSIVGSGLNQFVPHRNDEISMGWEIGDFGHPLVSYYKSNLLPIQVSGNTGALGQTLTVTGTNDPTGQNVTQITFSGASTSDSAAVNAGDLFQFNFGVSGKTDLYYLTYYGYAQSSSPVQFRATADSVSDVSGNVTISIYPALNWAGGQTKNLNSAIVSGMTVSGLPSHRAGMLTAGDAGFLAMPQLPDQYPFPTANEYDQETGCSIRLYYGTIMGQNQTGLVHDAVWGSTVVPEYSMRTIVPLSQGI